MNLCLISHLHYHYPPHLVLLLEFIPLPRGWLCLLFRLLLMVISVLNWPPLRFWYLYGPFMFAILVRHVHCMVRPPLASCLCQEFLLVDQCDLWQFVCLNCLLNLSSILLLVQVKRSILLLHQLTTFTTVLLQYILVYNNYTYKCVTGLITARST